MRVDLFDFNLPNELIALHPMEPRDSARLLVVRENGEKEDKRISDLVDLLQKGDVLVVNDTRVIPAELKGIRHRDDLKAKVSFNLHLRKSPSEWAAFARPAKKLKLNDRLSFGDVSGEELWATVTSAADAGEVTLTFDVSGAILDEAIKAHGAMPLPPYISAQRPFEERDKTDYQTVYADQEGAVAAPTAGLHFTDELLAKLKDKGIGLEKVTLHVGAGTFLPVKVDDTDEHKMHAEWGVITPETVERLNAAQQKGGRIVAVGTTSLRLLESAARKTGKLEAFSEETNIFIKPGDDFKVVDVLMTNFHLPKSTLFMLICAFSGYDTMCEAYRYAIENKYRFYSYGDGSLLFKGHS